MYFTRPIIFLHDSLELILEWKNASSRFVAIYFFLVLKAKKPSFVLLLISMQTLLLHHKTVKCLCLWHDQVNLFGSFPPSFFIAPINLLKNGNSSIKIELWKNAPYWWAERQLFKGMRIFEFDWIISIIITTFTNYGWWWWLQGYLNEYIFYCVDISGLFVDSKLKEMSS